MNRLPTGPDVSSGPPITPAAAVATAKRKPASGDAERKYLRGSYLLLAGRVIAILVNLATQVLTVRYLAKADFGAIAYALAIVAMGSSALQFGMGKALPRLVAIHNENGDYRRTFGTLALATYTVWGLGIVFMVLLFGLRGVIAGSAADPQSVSLLLILIALAPIGAYTTVLTRTLAVFIGARAIFFRRHVLAPVLKLAAVVAVIVFHGDVYLLAWGYLAGGVVGLWVCVAVLLEHWRKRGLLEYLHPSRMLLPVRELFGFSLPLLTTEMSLILRTTVILIILERFHSTASVAEYRAVLPVAALNLLVYDGFSSLFVPVASRMFARNERDAISALYWKTSMWITVLSVPILAVTCALAEPVTVLLFGTKYAGAGSLLAVLAAGHYVHAALGFNASSLQVHGKLRSIVINDLIAGATLVGLGFLLIPPYGAMGAAITMSATLVLHNVLNNLGLWLGNTGIRLIDLQFVRVYLIAVGVVVALLLVQWLFHPSIYASVVLTGILSLLVLRLTRHTLKPADTFPELLRIPLVRRLFT
jgi:O-antigen/teichoic acid export membrane protein